MAASILGTAVGYYFGLKTGKKIFTRENSLFFNKAHLIRAHDFYEKHGGFTIILARFVPIVRTFAPIVAGVGEMNYSKFMMYNIGGGILWIGSLMLLGYSLGALFPGVIRHLEAVIIIVVFLSILPGVIKYLTTRMKNKKQ